MALLRNSLLLGIVLSAAAAAPAGADEFDNYIYNYMGRGDTITIGAGDASRANLAIQHPTPWPRYVNDTHIRTPARQGVGALEKMFRRYEPGRSADSEQAVAPATGGAN